MVTLVTGAVLQSLDAYEAIASTGAPVSPRATGVAAPTGTTLPPPSKVVTVTAADQAPAATEAPPVCAGEVNRSSVAVPAEMVSGAVSPATTPPRGSSVRV